MRIKFSCIDGCSDCCMSREYYPSVEFGKIGVLLLPKEKIIYERLSRLTKIRLNILPRVGIGLNKEANGPQGILAYQMMGKEINGNTCPFLNLSPNEKAPHGGLSCSIYSFRPLACRAFPIVDERDNNSITLDNKCTFCKEKTNVVSPNGLKNELLSIREIKSFLEFDITDIPLWRYATGIGEHKDADLLYPPGWVRIN